MPHDKNGREVRAGDFVVGQGYNIKHRIVAQVLAVNASTDSCNITLLVAEFQELSVHGFSRTSIEYGATADFEIIERQDGTRPGLDPVEAPEAAQGPQAAAPASDPVKS